MLIAYNYKLAPNRSQTVVMEKHVEMLRLQYNFRIRERTEAYEQAKSRVLGNYCDLKTRAECCPLTCCVSKNALYDNPWTSKGKKRSALAQQDADLPNLKRERPWYGQIQHHVLQQMLRRVDDAFQRFFRGEAGYPKPKRRSKFRSFSYPPGDVRFDNNRLRLPGIGWMKFFQSRPFPDGFAVKSVTVRSKADGWYISVRLQDDSVPIPPISDVVKSAIGVDVGIAKLVSTNTGETIPNPGFLKSSSRRQRILHRRASRKKKGSINRRKAYQQLARLEQKIERQRADYQWKVAHKLTRTGDCIIFEDLNIKGMMARCKPKVDPNTGKYLHNGQAAKRGLNRAMADAAWGELKQKVIVVAAKSGVLVHSINPRHTSQECSCCGFKSPNNRDKEKFLCESCGHLADADVDAAAVIRQRGLKELGINLSKLPVVHGKVTPMEMSIGLPIEPGNLQKYKQLSLFEWRKSG
jgi:putative transposase